MRIQLKRVCRVLALAASLVAMLTPVHAQEYRSSVVGTDFDFIVDSDPSAFLCLESKGRGMREMPDKSGSGPLVQEAFRFVAYFEDGTSIDMALDVDFATEAAARAEATRYVHRLGKLPTVLRRGVARVVIHHGNEDTTAFSDRGLIVVYADNATKRISTHDLEETLFHESVHAAWDADHADSPEWRAAQVSDGVFATHYAKENPDGEDLAESALFAYTLVHHPERIPADAAARLRAAIPARIAFVEALLPPDEPILFPVGPTYPCDGSGTTFTVGNERGGEDECSVDLSRVGTSSDILSNALMRGLDQDSARVSTFLDGAVDRFESTGAMLAAASAEFGFDRATLDAGLEEYYHCNCSHAELTDAPPTRVVRAPAPPAPDEPASTELRGLLYVIAALMLLLLLVNVAILAVLVRRTKADSREG